MVRTRVRQAEQTKPSQAYDDTLPPGTTLESVAHLEADLNAIRSQLKRIIYDGDVGNWYDDLPLVDGARKGLKQLAESVGGDVTPKILLMDTVDEFTYVGEAIPGSATDEAVWRLYRLDESAVDGVELKKLYANGSTEFDQVWDDRTAITVYE